MKFFKNFAAIARIQKYRDLFIHSQNKNFRLVVAFSAWMYIMLPFEQIFLANRGKVVQSAGSSGRPNSWSGGDAETKAE